MRANEAPPSPAEALEAAFELHDLFAGTPVSSDVVRIRETAVARIDDAAAFAAANQVLLLRHDSSGIDVDLSLAWLPRISSTWLVSAWRWRGPKTSWSTRPWRSGPRINRTSSGCSCCTAATLRAD